MLRDLQDDVIIFNIWTLLFLAWWTCWRRMKLLGFFSRNVVDLLSAWLHEFSCFWPCIGCIKSSVARWLALVHSHGHISLMKRCVSWWNAPLSNIPSVRILALDISKLPLHFIPLFTMPFMYMLPCFFYFFSFIKKFITQWWMIQMTWKFLHVVPNHV